MSETIDTRPWISEGYSDKESDMSDHSSDNELDGSGSHDEVATGKPKSRPTKRLGEDKLHEKRLKERARRNGMAKSIDQMRVLVPELTDSKKAYSQAKVVAIALQHIIELQRENAEFRQKLGLKPRDSESKPIKSKSKPAKQAKTTERGRKRRRAEEDEDPNPRPRPPPPGQALTQSIQATTTINTTLSRTSEVEVEDVSSFDDLMFSNDSLSVADTPTLSPRSEPTFSNYDHFDSRSTLSGLDWNELDTRPSYHLEDQSFLELMMS